MSRRLKTEAGTGYTPHPFFKKMRPGEMVNSQAKQVILNVFFQLASLNPQKPWKSVANETAMLTGVSVSTVFRLKTEKTNSMYQENKTEPVPNCEGENVAGGDQVLVIDEANQHQEAGDPANQTAAPAQKKVKREPRPVSPRSIKRKVGPHVKRKKRLDLYDESILTTIRLRLHQYCARKDSPTVGEFMSEINADPNMPSFSRSTFHHLLKDMGLSKFCKKKARQKVQKAQQQQHQHQQQQQQHQAPPPQQQMVPPPAQLQHPHHQSHLQHSAQYS